jgi:hypothetical protein
MSALGKTAIFLVLATAVLTPAWAGSGGIFASTNAPLDGPGHCRNGDESLQCNVYDGKKYAWFGGDSTASLEDGFYLFTTRVPGGNQNLSADDPYQNRVFTVANGVISYRGAHDFASGKVRLAPFEDTTNPGGEYEFVVCPIGSPEEFAAAHGCRSHRFKVQEAPNVSIGGILYYDRNSNGSFQLGEPTMPGRQIKATILGGERVIAADSNGRWSLLLPEGTEYRVCQVLQGDYQQTGPNPGARTPDGSAIATGDRCWEGKAAGDTADLSFGNYRGDGPQFMESLWVTKTAATSFNRAYTWQFSRSANLTGAKQTGFTDSAWRIEGIITVSNPNAFDVSGINVTDAVNDPHASCIVESGTGLTIRQYESAELKYVCSYSEAPKPSADTNAATAIWPLTGDPSLAGNASGIADFDFAAGENP